MIHFLIGQYGIDVVDGLSFKEKWIPLLTSFSTELIMFMVLDSIG